MFKEPICTFIELPNNFAPQIPVPQSRLPSKPTVLKDVPFGNLSRYIVQSTHRVLLNLMFNVKSYIFTKIYCFERQNIGESKMTLGFLSREGS